ncbi:hypothetical protein MMC07_003507 [Pseudocyphellaria aurata]|nr:hypothetical protein [Pseudocyphellaria aurata]
MNENKKAEIQQMSVEDRCDAVSGLAEWKKPFIPILENEGLLDRKYLANYLKVLHPAYVFSMTIFHLCTLWLFTVSEHQTIVFPWTAFGLFGALSGWALTTNQTPDFWVIMARLPSALLWMWWHILVFTVANQRLPSSVIEDSINKAWRPLPSGRITGVQARRLLLVIVPATFVLTDFLGAAEFSRLSLLLTWLYNDLEGADENYIIRNLINSLGLVCWSAGTTMVACGKDQHQLNAMGYHWLKIEAAIVFTTLQVQDLRDQKGDRARGRRTAPIALGDVVTRWTIAVPVLCWSFAWRGSFIQSSALENGRSGPADVEDLGIVDWLSVHPSPLQESNSIKPAHSKVTVRPVRVFVRDTYYIPSSLRGLFGWTFFRHSLTAKIFSKADPRWHHGLCQYRALKHDNDQS